MIAIIGAMKQRTGIDGVILAGTELGLLLPGSSYHGVPVVDSAKAHVDGAVRWLLDDTSP